jgi:dihydroneopterin aldolase
MNNPAFIELRNFKINTQIGVYAAGEVVPKEHLLDLRLSIDPKYVLIAQDGMQHVFDYDPLVTEIERLGAACHYETQERLLTCIAQACANYVEINSVDILLRKSPLGNGSGSLGVRVKLDEQSLHTIRN